MIRNIRKIGNSQGIIIPQYILQEIGSPTSVDITTTKDGIFITPIAGKTVRRKQRNEDETNGLYELMKSKIESNLNAGKTRWTGDREMERRL
jgi:antitoxin component of MazEF toxin-antitoxin module